MKSAKLPYGNNPDGQLVHITDVPSGLACKCSCVGCGAQLIAVNKTGNKQIPHFRHHNAEECGTALETALHLAAKHIILSKKRMVTPIIHADLPKRYDSYNHAHTMEPVVFTKREYEFDWVILEDNSFSGYIPDVVGIHGVDRLLIEIYVTHAVDEKKEKKVRPSNEYMIEIDLSNVPAEIIGDKQAFSELLIKNTDNKKWISHPEARAEFREKRQRLNQYVDTQNKKYAKEKASEERQKQEKRQRQIKSNSIQGKAIRARLGKLRSTLKAMQSDHWIDNRNNELEKLSIKNDNDLFLDYPIKNDWLINTHRTIWQKWIFDTYITSGKLGDNIRLNEVKKEFLKHFDCIPELIELDQLILDLKYSDKYDLAFILDLDLDIVSSETPSIFNILKDYFLVLVAIGALAYDRKNYILMSNRYKIINNHIQRQLQQPEIEFKHSQLNRLLPYHNLYYSIKIVLNSKRREFMKAAERRLFFEFQGSGRKCMSCLLVSHVSDGDRCPFCGASEFYDNHLISRYDLDNLDYRYRTSPQPSMSCSIAPYLSNLHILKDWGID